MLVTVAISYYQTLDAYPSGGGSYVVASENLGKLPGLIAASALLIGYILTAAVSLTAGVAAIASAYPTLWPHRTHLALGLLIVITLINLRGSDETGNLMSIPVYLFLFTYLPMLAYGAIRLLIDGHTPLVAIAPPATEALTTLLILHTFSAGCTALTGIEAISNGISLFKPPQTKNARQTLAVIALLMAVLFIGSIGLTQGLAVIATAQETILSALARRLLGSGPLYLLVQTSTMLILAVAANTSFAGFPRLAAILAADGYLPRQLTNLGDRLVFSNGIVALAAITGGLMILFGGDSHALIPLFAVGVFLAFTLSQAGMVVHWWRKRGRNWPLKLFFNSLGALTTASTVLIIGASKFFEGAWLTIFFIPALVYMLLQIRLHYHQVASQLSLRGIAPAFRPFVNERAVIPVTGIHRGMIDAVNFAHVLFPQLTALHIELEPGSGEELKEKWNQWWPDVELVVVSSPYRSIVAPFLDFLDETDRRHADGQQAVVILPEIVPAKWWQNLLHNQTAWLIKSALLYRRRNQGFQRVIIDIPYHLER